MLSYERYNEACTIVAYNQGRGRVVSPCDSKACPDDVFLVGMAVDILTHMLRNSALRTTDCCF